MHPVFFGAALTGVGVARPARRPARRTCRPPAVPPTSRCTPRVFKIEPDATGHPAGVRPDARRTALLPRRRRPPPPRAATAASWRSPARAQRVATFAAGADHDRHARRSRATSRRSSASPTSEIGDQLGRWDPAYGVAAVPAARARVRRRRPRPRRPRAAVRGRPAAQRPGPAHRRPARRARPRADRQPVRRGAARGAHRAGWPRSSASTPTSPRRRTVHVERVAGPSASGRCRCPRATPASPCASSRVGRARAAAYRMGTERGYLLPALPPGDRGDGAAGADRPACSAGGSSDWVVTLTDARFSAPTPPAGYFRDLTERALRRALGRGRDLRRASR